MTNVTIVKELLVLPSGMQEDDVNMHHYALRIVWRGPFNGRSGGGYAVIKSGGRELSRAGKWGNPENFQRWQYRFETFDRALHMAQLHVNEVKVMGLTYAQWRQHE